jgi:penicillin-binding protein 1C
MIRKKTRLFLALAAISCLLLAAYFFLSAGSYIPSYAETKAAYRPSEAWLLDRHGEIIAIKRINNKVRRLEWLGLNDISPATQELLVISEDKHFYEHAGVDWPAVLASAGSNLWHLFDGKRPRGASTITMQLAGFLDPALAPSGARRTVAQKWRQIVAARAIEKSWSKPQIMEAYFNLAPFRGEVVGVHAASFALFGRHPSALDRSQSLLLMALLKGPRANSERVASRACALLKATQHEHDPSCEELRDLAQIALDKAGYQIPQENIAPHLAQKLLQQPGVRVTSTLDANLQRYAIQSLREHLLSLGEQNVSDGAAIVIDNKSGDVLAYVASSGSISPAENVDGIMALRQAGSTLKPFLYGMAIANRQLTAASVLDDSPIQLITPVGLYIPQNYDHDFKGAISVRTALGSSLNVPAVRTLGLVGVDHFVRTLRSYGLNLPQDGNYYGFSLALGGVDISLLDLSNAYRALANQGVWHPVRFNSDDSVKGQRRVLSAQAAFIIADILSDKGARALTFGLENPLATRVWTAVKTGTSKDMRDNWCMGFSSRYTVGVWVGNFSGTPMKDVSGVSGAAPVWRELMDYLHSGSRSTQARAPGGVVSQQVRYTPEIEAARKEWFIKGTETSEIRLASDSSAGLPHYSKILYPTNGTVIAMDPDIPTNHQRVQLNSEGAADVIWLLDGEKVGTGTEAWWSPTGGRHKLVLTDGEGKELDSVGFEVRGAMIH